MEGLFVFMARDRKFSTTEMNKKFPEVVGICMRLNREFDGNSWVIMKLILKSRIHALVFCCAGDINVLLIKFRELAFVKVFARLNHQILLLRKQKCQEQPCFPDQGSYPLGRCTGWSKINVRILCLKKIKEQNEGTRMLIVFCYRQIKTVLHNFGN